MSSIARACLVVSAAALGAFVVVSPAAALDCGQRLVTQGDSQAYVRSVCGEPEGVSSHTESVTDFASTSVSGRTVVGSARTVEVQIDVWVYDFGRTRFMEELTFANGSLRSSRSLGYGTVAGERRRRESLDRHGMLMGVPYAPALRAILPGRRRV